MPSDIGRILPDYAPGSFIWRVESFFSHPQDEDGYYIDSPVFSALGTEWWLCIDPSRNVDGASRTRLKLLKPRDYSPKRKFAHFQFGIRGRGGAELVLSSGKMKIGVNHNLCESIYLPASWRQNSEEFAPGGVLSVFFRERGATPGNNTGTQTEDIGQVPQECGDGASKSCSSPENDSGTRTRGIGQVPQECGEGASKSCSSLGALKVLEDLKGLLSSEEACDVTLIVQNQEFKAHKALLVARSSVFRAMFCHEMAEKLGNEVHITDCAPDAFRIFLRHVYTGDAEDLSINNAFDVFSVADKYDATELKIQCKDCLAGNITVENVCDVVNFSLLHSDPVLLEMASEFFAKHLSQILLTNQWQSFLRDHTTAANELLIKASKFHVPPE